ncbi:hypothetical protein [Alphabaculovirus myunipunctae]|uniref:Uncharacterized protein n=1 Tax=Mythimna unipuncta nucleopolyhedrovirus TaxID=447897 RepID=A0A2K9VSK2_9ABAC|nr:hypothetical protein [Mythimna unipuncta nucleopolyhedrovirus]AUV65416.1 hypothetical protein [Mythimna unipuncta nucleopolyhedrovirus]
MFAYWVIRRACLFADGAHRRALFDFVEAYRVKAVDDIRTLMDQVLIAFDVNLVYSLIEHIKSIVWALVRTAYARNANLLSSNRHRVHLDYVAGLLDKVSEPKKLYECTRDLFKRYCVYELAEDSLSWNSLVALMCKLNGFFYSDKSVCSKNDNAVVVCKRRRRRGRCKNKN